MITSAMTIVGMITLIGGAAYKLGDAPPWLGKEQFAQYQQQQSMMYAQARYSQVLEQIARLQNEQRRRQLSPIENDFLRSLLVEQRMLACQLRIGPCN